MIAIPFVWFSILFVFIFKKNKKQIDIASYIALIFAVSGFFSILIDVFKLRYEQTNNYSITPIAAFIYCTFITMCIWPLYINSNAKITRIKPLKNAAPLKWLAWISSVLVAINLYMSLGDFSHIMEDMARARIAHYMGDDIESWQMSLPSIVRLPFTLLNVFFNCPWMSMFLAFYCVSIQKLPFRYGLMYLLVSMNPLIGSILIAGRAGFIFWFLSLVACHIFFKQFFNASDRRKIYGIVIAIGGIFIAYLALMTIARFGESDSGTEGGLITYIGQSYIHFCYFFDEYTCPRPTLQSIFPFTYYLFGSDMVGGVAMQQYYEQQTGKELGVFYTFMGTILTTSSFFVVLLYCVLYTTFSSVTNKAAKGIVSIKTCYVYLAFASVLFLGLFSYYYCSPWSSISLYLFYFFIKYICK